MPKLVLHASVLLFIISINYEKSIIRNRKIIFLSLSFFLSYFTAVGKPHSNLVITVTAGVIDINFVKP